MCAAGATQRPKKVSWRKAVKRPRDEPIPQLYTRDLHPH
ncbi:predicted protein [Plenodomus lingam JN3]|uniref:Uncharacterized protein n=1 Tax=Leptosphaeria maculans (strain JN3 / isolate v23.1.3 / race Av1-4-5-6-7-8) TaxID=985895 RepID=E4ZGP2_LEPMJ|nr:predicted protein [Plenodomus lingam JN3]CBX90462.1 predicted protein [Plenodomus lingam JN3]